ncbi:hypothetical protein BXZ70DRAFT_100128 [Cristinia sonorae]|uniref:Uncharacterized protein n=1 Tax=Cristinia sonorae TaxID=1940300 RepID=A0A8K0UR30_9AGAR|nr:hypothetical protein BXZ70DRAFT_100128 [Cristinia sonorae]
MNNAISKRIETVQWLKIFRDLPSLKLPPRATRLRGAAIVFCTIMTHSMVFLTDLRRRRKRNEDSRLQLVRSYVPLALRHVAFVLVRELGDSSLDRHVYFQLTLSDHCCWHICIALHASARVAATRRKSCERCFFIVAYVLSRVESSRKKYAP